MDKNRTDAVALILTNDEMKKIVKFFDVASLKVCREVCNQFNVLASAELVKRQVYLSIGGPAAALKDWECELDSSENVAFMKKCLWPAWKIDFRMIPAGSILNLLETYGDRIIYLNIRHLMVTEDSLKMLEDIVLRWCPNLEEITVNFVKDVPNSTKPTTTNTTLPISPSNMPFPEENVNRIKIWDVDEVSPSERLQGKFTSEYSSSYEKDALLPGCFCVPHCKLEGRCKEEAQVEKELLIEKRLLDLYGTEHFKPNVPILEPKIVSVTIEDYATDGAFAFLITILQICDNLKTLRLIDIYSPITDNKDNHFDKLLRNPYIIPRLNTLAVTESEIMWESRIKTRSGILKRIASNELRFLEIGRTESRESAIFLPLSGEDLTINLPLILRPHSETLQSLKLHFELLTGRVSTTCPFAVFPRHSSTPVFPPMLLLTILEVQAEVCPTVNFLNLVDAAPNLERCLIFLSESSDRTPYWDTEVFFSELQCLDIPPSPHEKLKHFTLEPTISREQPLRYIVSKFPNLEYLSIKARRPEMKNKGQSWDVVRKSVTAPPFIGTPEYKFLDFHNVLHIASELKRLKKFVFENQAPFSFPNMLIHMRGVLRMSSLQRYIINKYEGPLPFSESNDTWGAQMPLLRSVRPRLSAAKPTGQIIGQVFEVDTSKCLIMLYGFDAEVESEKLRRTCDIIGKMRFDP
jgi:hypothetical protein